MEITPILPPLPLPDAFQLPGPSLGTPLLEAPMLPPIPPSLPNTPPPPAPSTDSIAEQLQQLDQFQQPVIDPPQEAEEEEEEEEKDGESEEDSDEEGLSATDIDIPLPQFDNSFTVPIVGTEMPLPTNEVMIVTATTATIAAAASVGAAIAAKTIFDYLLKLIKPIIKTITNKILKARGKKPITWGRQKLLKRQRKSCDKG